MLLRARTRQKLCAEGRRGLRKPLRIRRKTWTKTWKFGPRSHDYFGSVETSAEYENWSLQKLEKRQEKKKIQEMAK